MSIQITGLNQGVDITLKLDTDAIYALVDLLDLIDAKDIVRNPDSYSLDVDSAKAVRQVSNDLFRVLGRR